MTECIKILNHILTKTWWYSSSNHPGKTQIKKWYHHFKHGHTSERLSWNNLGNSSWSENKHRINVFHFNRGFVHVESVGEICPQSAGGAAEETPHGHHMVFRLRKTISYMVPNQESGEPVEQVLCCSWPRKLGAISAQYVQSSCIKTKIQPALTTCLYSMHNSQKLTRPTSTKVFKHMQDEQHHLPPKGFCPWSVSFSEEK